MRRGQQRQEAIVFRPASAMAAITRRIRSATPPGVGARRQAFGSFHNTSVGPNNNPATVSSATTGTSRRQCTAHASAPYSEHTGSPIKEQIDPGRRDQQSSRPPRRCNWCRHRAGGLTATPHRPMAITSRQLDSSAFAQRHGTNRIGTLPCHPVWVARGANLDSSDFLRESLTERGQAWQEHAWIRLPSGKISSAYPCS